MGVGMVIATDKPVEIIDELISLGEEAFLLGRVTKGSGKVFLDNIEL
jgi:phosphoribosylaminoimidazole (AIR) synthetase